MQKINLSFSDFDLHNRVRDTFPNEHFSAKYIDTQIIKKKQTNKQTKTKIHLDFVASSCGSPPLIRSDVFRKQISYEGALQENGNMLKHHKSVYT